jgi:CheY-like chemotaxis protein
MGHNLALFLHVTNGFATPCSQPTGADLPKYILIVEDDPDCRTIYQTALEGFGYEVLIAAQGAEGVHLARRHRPDLILMDIRMPVMDGWEAIRYLKADPYTCRIPVCAISAHVPQPEDQERVQRMGFDCFLMKPIDPKQIVAEVEKRIGPPRSKRSPHDAE